jgi:uncharacterized protein YndB with AHSA1/START domain
MPGTSSTRSSPATMVAGAGLRVLHLLEVDPPHRLLISWGHAGSDRLPPGTSSVDVRLSPAGGGTEVEIEHRDLPEDMRAFGRGWPHFVARLAVVAAGGDPGPDTLAP